MSQSQNQQQQQCYQVPVEQSRILPGEPVPDYSYPLRDIGDTLRAIRTLLEEQKAHNKEFYPQIGDEDEYDAGTETGAASATTTITWTLLPNYIYYFRKIFIDGYADLTYTWTFESVLNNAKNTIVLVGNSHEFDKPIKANGNTTLTLAIVNSSATAQALDYAINVWSRRIK